MITYNKFFQASAECNGAATVIPVLGALATDSVMARLVSSDNSVTLDSQAVTANTVTLTFSSDPGTGEVCYTVIRPLS